ncbi:hypothetical protein RclHR1_05430004 [Rhizophagus clarus]|uniref:Uncharacterized protein n=1 Tax=Rhizophagus clarus TaxID=94130 RepID=A0A2Z6RND8_9GLOM|nr:hypothetical protein RclHR1_05430004 [Rhizophagus clarus]GES98312.1 hypothetical protein RCL_jg24696.t1 [Rhizophagus clarus]
MSSTNDHISVAVEGDPAQDQSVIDTNAFLQFLLSQGMNKSSNTSNTPAPTATATSEKKPNHYFLPISENIFKELLKELFGEPSKIFNDTREIKFWFQKTCFVLAGLYKSKQKEETYDRYVMHLIIMARFVLRNKAKARTSDFIKFYNLQPESNKYFLGNDGEDFSNYYVNYVFCSLLNINQAKEENVLFEDLVYSAFPYGRNVLSLKQKNESPPSVNRTIDLSMNKMKNFLLDFEVVGYFDEHFNLRGHKVSICNYEFEHQEVMFSYMHNKLAILYGVEMAGIEILKTYTFLTDDKASKDIMLEYKIWRGFEGFEEAVFRLTHGRTYNIGYTLLANKFFGLERKINSFWFRFQRETNHRRLYQPVDYYFVVFSVFLGLLTVVQTTLAIVSLIFQVKS